MRDGEGLPLFVQIAQQLRAQIIDGSLPEEGQAPSTNELAAFYRINPATAAKGLNLLVDEGILYKKRGLGMFVKEGARRVLVAQRHDNFETQFVVPLVEEARALEISQEQVLDMVEKTFRIGAMSVPGVSDLPSDMQGASQ